MELFGLNPEEVSFALRVIAGKPGLPEGVRDFICGKKVEPLEEVLRHVFVDPERSLSEMLEATDRNIIIANEMLETAPRGEGGKASVYFFLDRFGSIDYLRSECAKRNYIPADPRSLTAVHETDRAFADDRRNCTFWRGPDGKGYFMVFDWQDNVRRVRIVPDGVGLEGQVWIACFARPVEIEPCPRTFFPGNDPYDGR